MFPNTSAGAIAPVPTALLASPFAAESERQATLGELMPYFLGYGKLELRWASGTLEKYEDAMSWVIRAYLGCVEGLLALLPACRGDPNHGRAADPLSSHPEARSSVSDAL